MRLFLTVKKLHSKQDINSLIYSKRGQKTTIRRHHLPVEEYLTGVQLQTTAESVEEGRLATPAGAHDGQDLTGPNESIYVLEDLSATSADGDAPEGEVDRERTLICD